MFITIRVREGEGVEAEVAEAGFLVVEEVVALPPAAEVEGNIEEVPTRL